MTLPALVRVRMDGEDPTRWLVDSAKRAGATYLVDLLDFPTPLGPNCSCTCPNFTIKRQQKIEECMTLGCFSRCKHIPWALEAYAMAMLMVELKRRTQ